MPAAISGERLGYTIRITLLVGMLGVFLWLLVAHLVADREARGFGALRQGTGRDPGVRVLIANRLPPEPILTHDRAVIEVLQPAELVAPDDPQGKHESLRTGARIRVEVVGNDGFLLSSKDWESGARDLRWAVQSISLMPRNSRPDSPIHPDKDGNPVVPSLRSFEAADQRAVFRLIGVDPKMDPMYRGSLQILWSNPKELQLINHLPMEAYVEGVIAVEMSPAWPLEALKAQAIASRGFAYCKAFTAAQARRPWDLLDTREDQEYHGAGYSTLPVVRAAVDTRGVVPTIHGAPFIPLFSASSGGATAAIDTVFPGARDVYGREPLGALMIGHADPYCLPGVTALRNQDTHWQTTADIPAQDIQKRLAAALQASGAQLGYITQIRVGRREARTNRVQSVLVHHTLAAQPIEIPANTFRSLVGPQLIHSTLWPSDPTRIEGPDRRVRWHFTCLGWGHGVGMSQASAWEMARQGQPARNILAFFYQDAELRALW